MIAIIDYDAGNIKSVEKAFLSLGQEVVLTRDPEILKQADRVVLPGVGNFKDAMEKLESFHLVEPIKEVVASGKPFLGICLGLQLLFEGSDEAPGVKGLGILPGVVKKFPETVGVKIPHMGWNNITASPNARLFKNLSDEPYVYFVHSYYLEAANRDDVAATCNYILDFDASVEHDNIFACQFHPEKSSTTGLKILKNFTEI